MQKWHKSDAVPFLLHYMKYVMSVGLILGAVNLDYWVKLLSVGFLH